MIPVNFFRSADDEGDTTLTRGGMQGQKMTKSLSSDQEYQAFQILHKEDSRSQANTWILILQDTNCAPAIEKNRRGQKKIYHSFIALTALMNTGYKPAGIPKYYNGFTIHIIPEKVDMNKATELVASVKNLLKRLRICPKMYNHAA